MSFILPYLHFAGILQALFLSLYYFRERKVRGNLFYGAFLLALTGSLLIGFLYDSGEIFHFLFLARVGFPLTALSGSFFYLGIRGQFTDSFRKRYLDRGDWIFFVVPAGIFLYLIPFYLSGTEEKLRYLQEDLDMIHLDCTFINILSLVYVLGMTILAYVLLERVSRLDVPFPRSQEREILRQKIFTALLVLVPFYWGALSVYNPNLVNSGSVSIATTVIVFLMSLDRIYYTRSDPGKEDIPAPLYSKALLSEEAIERIGSRLDRLMEKEKVHRDPDLKLDILAERLNVSRNHLSQVVNRRYGKKLPDLINTHRIQDALQMLESPEFSDYTILRIALECGFNSKSTFHSAFKKQTGRNPTDLRSSI